MRDWTRAFLALLGRHPGGLTLRRAARLLGISREDYRHFRRDILLVLREERLQRSRGRFLLPGSELPAPAASRRTAGAWPTRTARSAPPPAAFVPASVETERAQGMAALLAEFGLQRAFPAAAETEAERRAAQDPAAAAGRRALGELTVLCIDPADARDHDDAISLEPRAGGGWRLGVHIADVAEFVPLDGALDREARRRGNSTYFYLDTIPMLPPLLSGEQCSLLPGQDRAAISLFLDLDAEGELLALEAVETRLRVSHSLSYEEAETALASAAPSEPAASLRAMHALAERLGAGRAAGGALQFELPEIRPHDRGEGVEGFRPVRVLRSHHIVEEFMLAANHAVGRLLRERGRPGIYRVHPPPAAEDLAELLLALQRRKVNWRPGHQPQSADYQRLAALLAERPDRELLLMKMLRSLAKAAYSLHDQGHFGLAWWDYLHFTSPIRRYADLTVHRELKAMLPATPPQGERVLRHSFGAQPPRKRAAGLAPVRRRALETLARELSDCELNSLKAEREGLRLEMVLWARQRLGETFAAELLAVLPTGIVLRLPAAGVEGFLPAALLGREYYAYDDERETLRGERTGRVFAAGQPLSVRLVEANLFSRRLQFLLEDEEAADETPSTPNRRRRS